MNKRIKAIIPLALALMLALSVAAHAEPQTAGELGASPLVIDNTDPGITQEVQEDLVNYPHVTVKTDKRVVTLSGTVDNKVERDTVIDMVNKRGDVAGVVDELRLRNNR